MTSTSGIRVWPGLPIPLGATWDGEGVNFALFSAHAEKVELCLFDERGKGETARIPLPEFTHEIWHGYFPDVKPGQLYGYRVHGPYEPEAGHRFNPHKLLIDPYARALVGELRWDDALFGYTIGHPEEDLSFDTRDSAPFMPLCRVVEPFSGERSHPRTPWHQTVLYEMHPRGFTRLHPEVPEDLRGTLEGLSSHAVIDHLRELGVTAVELMPVHAFVHDRHLVEAGLRNYWGYNTLGYFAPHPEYLGGGGPGEFRDFVDRMHHEGIEVILDVVYNHTAEGSRLGPTLSFRGIDNLSYYHLVEGDERYYHDFTGTGNALELRHRNVLRMAMDSLRYWVEEMGADGFRFDLATTLARVAGRFEEHSGFLDAVAQDPVLSAVKLIAEPWDTGDEGYQLGNFPPGWAEWNDRYRDVVRRFWRGDEGQLRFLATRFSGSADLFDRRGRRTWASVNFVTTHDGFTLQDLVSYERKHNEANQEENRDGADENHSWNCGVEGPTEDPGIRALRRKQVRNFLATLLLSQGTPMLLAGDELGRTQEGNNNAYCQDNAVNWLNWVEVGAEERALLRFTRRLLRLRRAHIVFHRDRFSHGETGPGTEIRDMVWIRPDGGEMSEADWDDPEARALGVRLSGAAGLRHRTEHGEEEPDDAFLVLMNASPDEASFRIPEDSGGRGWKVVVDTAVEPEEDPGKEGPAEEKGPGTMISVTSRSLQLLVLLR
jgi:isoamylase